MLWNAADGSTPLADIVSRDICPAFDIDAETALRDATELAHGLAERGILQVGNAALRHGIGDHMSVMQDMGARAMALGIPLSVQLDLTYRCNERCIHCYLDHEDHGEMKTAEILGLLDQLAAAGVFFLNVSGGEIFMRPDLFTIIEHARKLQFSVKLKTNGVMIRAAKAQRIAKLGIEAVQISLYSHDAATHDEITKLPGSFKRTIEGAQFLRDAGVKVIFANVLMKQNADHYKQVQALATSMGIRYEVDATITPMMDGDRGIVGLNMDAGRLAGIMHDTSLLGDQAERLLARAEWPDAARRSLRDPALQRRPHRLLRLALWRRVPLRAVPVQGRQRPRAGVHRHLARLAAAQRRALDPRQRPAGLLVLRARQQLHPLPGPGVPGRQHARPVDPGLREVLRPHRRAVLKNLARRDSCRSRSRWPLIAA
jgi:organic radical activating enzyme